MISPYKLAFSNDGRTPSGAHQQGVALMIVILVFALVTILSVGMYNRQSLFIQQAGNIAAQTQAYEFALTAEKVARAILKEDWDKDKKDGFFDDLESISASLAYPFENALLEAQFDDVQGRLNLNDLVNLDGSPNTLMIDRFKRLFTRLNLDTAKLEVIIDWLDEDQNQYSFDGAEDGDYLGLSPPFRTSKQSFFHGSELRLMFGLELDDYRELSKFVVALPRGFGHTNVNTAPAEVLQALIANLTDQEAEQLIEARDSEAWKTIADFKAEPTLDGKTIDETHIGVNALFYELAIKVTFAERTARLKSLIYRAQSDGAMSILRRDQGQKYLITKENLSLVGGSGASGASGAGGSSGSAGTP